MGEKSEVKLHIPTKLIQRNEENPRLIFSEEGMQRLTESIKEVGILVPLTVYKKGANYIILDGERRWRSAQRINLQAVPCYVLPEPANRLEYILNMFKIHNVREEWNLLPTAQKLDQVIKELLARNPESKITDKQLAMLTGLPSPTVSRCRQLMTLPEKYQNMLFEEEKLAEKGIKPTKTTLTEDFFLELLRAISAIESKQSGLQKFCETYNKEQIIASFVEKFKSENIPDITDFRYLTKLVKQTKLPLEKRERILTRILGDKSYRIDEAYDSNARMFYESKGLEKQLDKIEMILDSLDVSLLDRGSGIFVLNSLENFKKIIQSKIAELRKNLGKEIEVVS